MRNTILGIKMALLGAAISAPIGVVAEHWDRVPARTEPARLIFDDMRPAHDRRTYPQYDGGDPRFIINPDGEPEDLHSTDRACAPDAEDCGDEPDDPADAIYRT